MRIEGRLREGDANMVMSLMCKKIIEDGKDHPNRERSKISRELGRAKLDFLEGLKNN